MSFHFVHFDYLGSLVSKPLFVKVPFKTSYRRRRNLSVKEKKVLVQACKNLGKSKSLESKSNKGKRGRIYIKKM